MRNDQALECWNCQRKYTFPLPKAAVPSFTPGCPYPFPKTEVARFIAQCPYCDVEGVVDLSEYNPSKDILRGDGRESNNTNGYILPDLIKTKPVEE